MESHGDTAKKHPCAACGHGTKRKDEGPHGSTQSPNVRAEALRLASDVAHSATTIAAEALCAAIRDYDRARSDMYRAKYIESEARGEHPARATLKAYRSSPEEDAYVDLRYSCVQDTLWLWCGGVSVLRALRNSRGKVAGTPSSTPATATLSRYYLSRNSSAPCVHGWYDSSRTAPSTLPTNLSSRACTSRCT